jgi:hypothetical protein
MILGNGTTGDKMSSVIVETGIVKKACRTAVGEIGKWRIVYREKQLVAFMDTTTGYLWWKRKRTFDEAVAYVDGKMCAKMDCWAFMEFQFKYWDVQWQGVINTAERLLKMCRLADKIELSSGDAEFVGKWSDFE